VKWLLWGLAAVNVYTFWLMGIDKARARRGVWRISEKRLLLSAACFGGLGATLAMFLFRHKTLHPKFRFGLPAMLIAQTIVILFLVGKWMNYV